LEFVSASFGIALLCFAGNHIYLVFKNATTIESFEFSRNGSPYDLGKATNWRQVFGPSPWLWFVPVANMSGTGLYFPHNEAVNPDSAIRTNGTSRRSPSEPTDSAVERQEESRLLPSKYDD